MQTPRRAAVPESIFDKQCKGTIMSNDKGRNNKSRTTKTSKPKRKKYADDRTPAVKRVDRICKPLAVILALLLLANVHVLMGGGGYDDTKIVTVLGFADSKIETDIMETEIHERSAVFTKTQSEYNVGDIVQYFDGEYNPVRRITEISDDGKTYTVQGDNEAADKAVKIDAKNVSGRVFFSSKALYGFLKVYHSVVGAAATVLISFLLLIMADLLMYKKRKAALEEKRAAQARKEARKLKVKQGLEDPESEVEENPVEKRRAEKEAKLEKERAEIAAEMKEIRKKMKAEEEELKKGKRGKK